MATGDYYSLLQLLYVWKAADWNKCDRSLLCVEFADIILIFAVLERRLLQLRETEASTGFYNVKL